MGYKERKLEKEIFKHFDIFPIVTITGPRQAGKSTLIKHIIDAQWKYYSLDNRELLLRINDDPSLFSRTLDGHSAIDEAQKAPELFHSLKLLVDTDYPYKIILSGSANFLLMKSITESLAGRVGLLELLPFSLSEALQLKSNNFIKTITNTNDIKSLYKNITLKENNNIDDNQLLLYILYGGYPKIYNLSTHRGKWLWFQNYITTYLERDLRDLAQVANLDIFQRVYKLIAFHTGNIINMSTVAADVGVSVQTIKSYISLLQKSYQAILLPAYYFNQRKQITKSPKIYYFDTGLVNYFMQNNTIEKMTHSPQWGSILESFVFSEFYKEIKDMVPKPSLYYWRTNNGAEVDFVIEHNDTLIPIEIKAGMHIKKQSIRGLKSFIESQKPGKIPFAVVLYRGEKTVYLEENILAIPLTLLF